MANLYLFDVDGTLFGYPCEAHRRAFQNGFNTTYGTNLDRTDMINIGEKMKIIHGQGMTDRQILHLMGKYVIGNGIKNFSKEEIAARINECMERMVEEFCKSYSDNPEDPLPGVHELLDSLSERGHMLGHLTGNVEGIAKMRMKGADLDKYFTVGAYGSDPHTDRHELGKKALERAKSLGFHHNGRNAWNIGDSPRDIKCAKICGLRPVAVATGESDTETLQKYGPEFVFGDLTETDRILKSIEAE